jgi:hypothetical protein
LPKHKQMNPLDRVPETATFTRDMKHCYILAPSFRPGICFEERIFCSQCTRCLHREF